MVIITDSKSATSELIDMISDNVNGRANIPAAFLSGANGYFIVFLMLYFFLVAYFEII